MNIQITIILALAISYVHSHGTLLNPICRGSIWRLRGAAQPAERFGVIV